MMKIFNSKKTSGLIAFAAVTLIAAYRHQCQHCEKEIFFHKVRCLFSASNLVLFYLT